MPYYHIWTIGCQMNKAESERLGSLFEELGYLPAAAPAEADIIVLNTCVVRQSAEDRAVNKLHLLRPLKKARPDLTIALTGCLVEEDNSRLRKRFPFVDYFFPPGGSPPWLEKAGAMPPLPQRPAPAVFVPIMRGCDNFCSYCIVPYRRGRERSRPVAELAAEVKELAGRGAREVTLLGQNVDSYGHDLPGKPDLADLLAEINGTENLARIRFLTNHPKDMSPRLIEAVAALEKVCENFSLPVQSGSDAVLRAMRRGYTAADYRRLVERIRRHVPGAALSTDVIVGFPGETEAQFRETFDLLSDVKFDIVHVAAYSPRTGTAAARELDDDVPLPEKQARLRRVEELQGQIAAEINARLAGGTVEVLAEGRAKGKWFGRTRTDKLVFFGGRGCPGELVRIKITKTSPWSLQGKLEENTD